jgi:hypothetical protein
VRSRSVLAVAVSTLRDQGLGRSPGPIDRTT